MKWPQYLIPVLLMPLLSCQIKTQSWWSEPQIVVLAEHEDWAVIQKPLKDVFEHVIRTPQPEKEYVLKHSGPDGYEQYAHTRYLILAASLETKGQIGDLVRRMLQDPEVRARVENGEQFSFVQKNPWAREQWMLVLVAKDIQTLREIIEIQGAQFYEYFNDAINAYLLDEMFERSEQKKLEKELMQLYGWKIRLHRDYFLAQALPREGIVWFRRTAPERWILVRWIEDADTSGVFTQDWIVNERNRIGEQVYGNDRIVDRYLFSYESEFLGRRAQVTTGLWENEAKAAGGPFKNYSFYDSISRRLYMVDVAVYAPEYDKVPLMRRLEIIAGTFQTLFDRELD
ncbi:DUF4837 family protein [candidate division KSB1 bacterium]|nr:DUF4837 family protein [candidate division KSB1 bacterium]